MNLARRVEQLERRSGSPEDFLLIVIASIGCDPEKMGAAREVHREVTGYRASGAKDRGWTPLPGESVPELKARMEAELRAEGHKVYAVCECYEASAD